MYVYANKYINYIYINKYILHYNIFGEDIMPNLK